MVYHYRQPDKTEPLIMEPKLSRREQILQSLAQMLEANPGERITTSALAKQVGVSEAALYRHFPSKAKMFDGLIEFIEETIFSRITLILQEEKDARIRCGQVLWLLLSFSQRNPGITRILTGDALAGETFRLRKRVAQFFDRLDTQLKQILREAELRENIRFNLPVACYSNLMLALFEGRIAQYVRSEFTQIPTGDWEQQWELISSVVFYE